MFYSYQILNYVLVLAKNLAALWQVSHTLTWILESPDHIKSCSSPANNTSKLFKLYYLLPAVGLLIFIILRITRLQKLTQGSCHQSLPVNSSNPHSRYEMYLHSLLSKLCFSSPTKLNFNIMQNL